MKSLKITIISSSVGMAILAILNPIAVFAAAAPDTVKCGVLNNLPVVGSLCNTDDFNVVINRIATFVISFIGLVLTVVILYCAVEIVTSGGSQERIKSAKGRLTQAAVSLGLLISFRAIIGLFGLGSKGSSGITLFSGVDTSSFEGVTQLLTNASQLLMLAIGALAVVMIVVGGVQYIASAGNESGTANAKRTITYAVSGLILALSVTAIIQFINQIFFS